MKMVTPAPWWDRPADGPGLVSDQAGTTSVVGLGLLRTPFKTLFCLPDSPARDWGLVATKRNWSIGTAAPRTRGQVLKGALRTIEAESQAAAERLDAAKWVLADGSRQKVSFSSADVALAHVNANLDTLDY
jgi:hypothetical protein